MILEEIESRKSGFAYSDKIVEDEKIKMLFHSAQLAPSSMNAQPWHYIYAHRNDPEFQLILSTLDEGNQRWAKDAAVLVVSIALVEYTYNNKVFHNDYAWHDTGMANALLMLQATSIGLATHPMGGFDHKKVSENFNVPKEYQPIAVIAIGYKGDETKLPDDLLKRQTRTRSRKPLTEVAFRGKFL